MCDVTPPGTPEIDTIDFELGLGEEQLEQFKKERPAFIEKIYRLIRELQLEGKIERLKICSQTQMRAVLYREPVDPWPSNKICMELYPDKYMDEGLLSHELGHEADRHNSSMQYDPEIESRWKDRGELEIAANLSLMLVWKKSV
jgi:hypothetical protein